jgi:ATP-binding cassette subfamily B protein
MEEGEIVQEGTHNELISTPGFYQDLYQEQLNG